MLRNFIILLCLTLIPTIGFGQDYTVKTRTWEQKDGLSNRYVIDIVEDNAGFIWLGTANGVQRFDGTDFKTWGESTGYSEFGLIEFVTIDSEGWLWAYNRDIAEYVFIHTVTEKILSQTQRFGSNFPKRYTTGWSCVFRGSDQSNYLYSAVEDTLISYLPTQGIKKIPLHLPEEMMDLEVVWINQDGITLLGNHPANPCLFLVSSTGKLLKTISLNPKSGWNMRYTPNQSGEIVLYEHIIDSDSWTNGIAQSWRVDWKASKLIKKNQAGAFRSCVDGDRMYSIEGHQFTVWKKDQRIIETSFDKREKAFTDAYPRYVDSKQRLWLCGSYGMVRVTIRESGFDRIIHSEDELPRDFNTSSRGLFVENDSLFAIFEFNGIAEIPLRSPNDFKVRHGKFTNDAHYYGVFNLTHIGTDLYVVRDGNLIQIGKNTTNEVPIKAYSSSGKFIRKMDHSSTLKSVYSDGTRIWIGANDGLWITELDGKSEFYRLGTATNVDIRQVQRIGSDVYVCSSVGLYRFDFNRKKLVDVSPVKDKNRSYNAISVGSDGTIYLGTNRGILIWNQRKNTIKEVSEKDGLSQNTVTGVYPDGFGNVWIATFNGLNKYDLATNMVQTYSEEDGITHSEFNYCAHYQDKNGKIYFGGLNGITVIDPAKEQSRKTFRHTLQLTQVEIFSENSKSLSDITGNVRLTKQFTYGVEDRFVKLKFTIPNQENPTKVLYAWKIEGVHDTWNYQYENSIQLTEIPYGSQVILLKGKSDEGIWTPTLRISVLVERPFYLQTWFLILTIGLTLFGLIGGLRWRTRTLRKREILLREQIEMATKKISEDKALIQHQADELRILDRAKTRFFTNVTHELKTPLALIKGPLGTVLNAPELTAGTKRHIQIAKNNTEQLLKLVTSLLDLSKFDSGVMKLDLSDVPLREFTLFLITHYESHAQQAEIALNVHAEIPPELVIRLDKSKCETILNNLLSNALKFTKSGGKIDLTVKKDDHHITFEVTDTGRGIPTKHIDRIFERFYQVPTEGITEEGGTGIGLSLSQELAKVMEAQLTVVSTLGQGSTFSLRIPLKESHGFVNETDENPDPVSEIERNIAQGKSRMLIVEDNPDLQEYLSTLMSSHDFRTEGAMNGKKALELLDRLSDNELPDVILSDIMMPEMDGYELLSRLKSNERYWSIPVIILTARSELQDKLRALRIGVDDYLLKPFEEEELIARVQNLMRFSAEKSALNEDEISQELEAKPGVIDQEWLKRLEEFIEKGLSDENFDVSSMHDHFAMSSSTFLRKVKVLTGRTPVEYLRESRLITARHLLENGEKETIFEVAFAVGFGNPKSFSRSFKNRFGKSPRNYF